MNVKKPLFEALLHKENAYIRYNNQVMKMIAGNAYFIPAETEFVKKFLAIKKFFKKTLDISTLKE